MLHTTGQIIDGHAIAKSISELTRTRAERLLTKGVIPHLVVILVGDDHASLAYIAKKRILAEHVGVAFSLKQLPKETTTDKVIQAVTETKNIPYISGVIVQLPLPPHIDKTSVINAIPPELDVDCMTDSNIGRLFLQTSSIVPPTPSAVLAILASLHYDLSGKRVVLVGTGQLVGKPLSIALLNTKATVTTCNETTLQLSDICREADVLVAGAGVPGLITKNMVKPGAIVIDTGAAIVSGKIAGDVLFDEVKEVAGAITPTPGGVGPITVATLLENTIICAEGLYR